MTEIPGLPVIRRIIPAWYGAVMMIIPFLITRGFPERYGKPSCPESMREKLIRDLKDRSLCRRQSFVQNPGSLRSQAFVQQRKQNISVRRQNRRCIASFMEEIDSRNRKKRLDSPTAKQKVAMSSRMEPSRGRRNRMYCPGIFQDISPVTRETHWF